MLGLAIPPPLWILNRRCALALPLLGSLWGERTRGTRPHGLLRSTDAHARARENLQHTLQFLYFRTSSQERPPRHR